MNDTIVHTVANQVIRVLPRQLPVADTASGQEAGELDALEDEQRQMMKVDEDVAQGEELCFLVQEAQQLLLRSRERLPWDRDDLIIPVVVVPPAGYMIFAQKGEEMAIG